MRGWRSLELLVWLLLAGAPLITQAESTATLPTITAYALDKTRVTLPKDMAGSQNVLILYFQPDQADAAAAWMNGLQSIRAAHLDLKTYVLPVYSKENMLYRWWIVESMSVGNPPVGDRHTTIPIFIDKRSFFKTLGVANEKQPFVLLTDKSGHIEWKTQGYFQQFRLDQLSNELGGSASAH